MTADKRVGGAGRPRRQRPLLPPLPPLRQLPLRPLLPLLPPLGICALLTVLGLLTHVLSPLSGLLLLAPVLAGLRLDARRTAAVGAVALLLGLLVDGRAWSPGFAAHWGGLLTGSVLSVHAAAHRTSLERDLARVSEVSRIAQAAILPPVAAEFAGTLVRTRHYCAAPETTVGGDLYDCALTPFGLRVIVGDVRGHGAEAMPLTAATISGFRDLAYQTRELRSVAIGLDARLTPRLADEEFVTAVLVEFGSGEVRTVNCGHPPPLRVGSGVKLLEPPKPALPLGLRPDPEQYRFRLSPGDRLLLYTDGLIEARDTEGTHFPLLEAAAEALSDPLPDAALDRLYDQVTAHSGGTLTDDVALVLCQPSDVPTPGPAPSTTFEPPDHRDHLDHHRPR
ncbi:PP2C family protein-serine/threonine phosphatase [Actinomycetota bacterium Odt1-20B]